MRMKILARKGWMFQCDTCSAVCPAAEQVCTLRGRRFLQPGDCEPDEYDLACIECGAVGVENYDAFRDDQ